jgi:hypothetical protein
LLFATILRGSSFLAMVSLRDLLVRHAPCGQRDAPVYAPDLGGPGFYSQLIGSTVEPLMYTSKCRWQAVDVPVVPEYPITWPRETR